jgi:hypothetical protein
MRRVRSSYDRHNHVCHDQSNIHMEDNYVVDLKLVEIYWSFVFIIDINLFFLRTKYT